GGRSDGNGLLPSGPLVFRRDIHDAVAVNVEGDFDLGNAAGSWGNARELEAAQSHVIRRQGPLTLENMDIHRRLIVAGRGEDLGLPAGYGLVSLDQRGNHAAQSLDTQGQGSNVHQDQALARLKLAGQNASLDRGA